MTCSLCGIVTFNPCNQDVILLGGETLKYFKRKILVAGISTIFSLKFFCEIFFGEGNAQEENR